MSTATALEQPTTAIADGVRFSLRGLPLLTGGATMDSVGLANNLWAHSKVYSTGGENAMHVHDLEDHCFLVLQGVAHFYFGDGSSYVARQFEGAFLPKGTPYRFHAAEGENLVLFRVGGGQVSAPGEIDPMYRIPKEILKRKGSDGAALEGTSKKNGTPSEPTVFAPGAFFAPG